MANFVYTKAKEAFLGADIDLMVDTINVALVSTSYAPSAAHVFASSVSSFFVGTPQALTGKSITNGIFDADDVTFLAVSGPTVKGYLFYKDTGSLATSPVIFWKDTAVAGLPLVPNGGAVTITFSNASGRIAELQG